jgi:hypothetical protein
MARKKQGQPTEVEAPPAETDLEADDAGAA